MSVVASGRDRSFAWLGQSLILAQRSLRKTSRNPGPIVNGVVTPALFMVLFVYLFGPSLAGSTNDYLRYLFPGILVMGTGLAGMISTGTAISLEAKNGVTDRLHSMPISRLAPLLGSVLADVVRYLLCAGVLFGLAALLGYRPDTGIAGVLAATGLAVAFGFALSWVMVFLAALLRDANTVLAVSFIAFLPLQLGTSLAVPVHTLPGWLATWAGINPVTHAMDACRALLNGAPAGTSLTSTAAWATALFVVFCPLAVAAYGREQ